MLYTIGTETIVSPYTPYTKNLNFDKIYSKVEEFFKKGNEELEAQGKKPRLGAQNKMKEELKSFITEVIAPQYDHVTRLDLNDKLIAEKVKVSERRAKQLRLKLKEIGVIFFYEETKQKKPGDYPVWLVRKEFINFENQENEVKAKKKCTKYKALFYKIEAEVVKDLFKYMRDNKRAMSIAQYSAYKNSNVTQRLAHLGLTRSDLLK